MQGRIFIKQTAMAATELLLPTELSGKTTITKMNTHNRYDVIIAGGSYSGLAAGMALGRAMRKVMIIDSGDPCNKQTPYSHNFLTNDGKAPGDIARLAKQQVQQYDTVHFLDARIISGNKTDNGFEVQTESGEVFTARKLVFATGIKDIMPDIPGFAECWGISVLHCPYCHGYEVRRQKTGILANGDNGFELSSLISNWTSDLTLYTNGKSTLTARQIKKLQKHHINMVEKEVDRIEHTNGYIENIIFKDRTSSPVNALYARLPFEQQSSVPHSLGCETTPEGYLITDPAHKTTVPGVFACGDNASRIRTVANAVSMGTTTGIMVNRDLIEEDF